MKKILLLYVFALLSIGYAKSQEICDDGIDNDGDGFIDCFDGDCADNSVCDGFYLGNDASCEAVPSEFPQFSLRLGDKSPNNVTTALSRIAIGDLDRDGIPEILTTNRYRDRIFLLTGSDASVKFEASTNNPFYNNAAMVNLQNDNCGEVFIVNIHGGDNFTISSFDCQLNLLWTSERLYKDPVFLSFADFDGDGKAEMYYKNEIRDPVTGVKIVANTGVNWDIIPGGPIAVDILGDKNLELIIGNKIYSVNLGNRSENAGSLTLLKTMPVSFQPKQNSGQTPQNTTTSVADYNLDGNLDVIVTGANGGNVTTAFLWDVTNNTVKTYSDPSNPLAPGYDSKYQFGWEQGMGRVNIADLDGDGQLNAAFVSGKYLYALDENWNLLWRVSVNEETSGITGCTLFDFNGDGQSEIVYRDEDNLYIINGNNGTVNTSQACRSRTSVEYPIVADVDADGSTEICIVCVSDEHNSGTPGRNLGLEAPAEVRIYKSGSEPWVPARRVWNQHGYFNVNINDDLTVPRNQQKHHLVWSSGTCAVGPVRPLNGFLNQSPFLSSEGCPTYASPDLNIIESTFSVTSPTCPDEDFTVSFDFENIGDVPLSGFVPITFYDGDPTIAGSNKLTTDSISLNNFNVGNVGSIVDLAVRGTGGKFTLYAVLNDNGSTTPTPISLPNSNFLECDYINNIVSAEVNPVPFELSTETTNNITCSATTVAPNGSARAFRLVGTTEETAAYDFFWFNGTTVDSTPDFTGAIYTGLSAGTYTVFAANKLVGCTSDTVQVEVRDSVRIINANITIDRGNSNCKTPNGKLTVSVNGGEPVGNFTYEWYEGNTVGGGLQISNSQVANSLKAATYSVLVTEKATGCQTIASEVVPDSTSIPVVTASATDIVCSDTNSGSVSASVGGATTGYTFNWYRGPSEKPTPDYTGSTINGLPKGSYSVKVIDNNSKCESILVTVVVDQTLAPVINSISSTEDNSCDRNSPNGTVTVSIAGNPADYTIEWFKGANTLAANREGTGLSLSNLEGASEYTVRVTNNSTGCDTTNRVNVIRNIVVPELSVTADPVTACSPYNGRIEATVNVDTESEYTFSWYIGKQVKATPDFSETGNILDNLEPGFYTVQAFHNTRKCLADEVFIEVIDQAIVAIVQNESVITLPNTCSSNDGVLEVSVNSPNNTSGFLLEWYNGTITTGTPFFTETGVTVSRAANLVSGIYTVVATDLDNGCSNSQVFNLPYADSHLLKTTSVVNNTNCSPNNEGEITVELTPTPLSGFDRSNYTINLYSGDDLTLPPVASQPGAVNQANYTFTGLLTGKYTIQALADATLGNCSVYSFATIELDATDPVINAISRVANTNCDPAFANGSIEVGIDNGASPSLYTISWFEGDDISTALGTNIGSTSGTNGEIATSLIGGSYTVRVLNNATQCSSTRTFRIVDNPIVVSIPSNDLIISPVTRCDINNGAANINNVYENGIVANMANYTFEWYDANMNILPDAITPNTTNSISALAEGTYFVKAISSTTGCESAFIEFSVETEITAPTITLNFRNPEQCVTPATGELRVNASAPSTTFTYNWYIGSNTTGAVAQVGPDFLNLDEGFYTVEITDNTSNCVYTETYELVTEVNPVNISSSATAVTNCDAPNGSVFATVTSVGNYSYTWRDVNGNIVGTTKEVEGLDVGEYTVTATDDSDAFCESTATVQVVNGQVTPQLTIVQVAPLSVCDLSLANGAARATVDGGFIGYTFEWFEGTSASGNVVYVGPEFSGLRDITYTVRVTDIITQCTNEASITITADIPEVEAPTIEVISNDVHCQIDNGALRVDVGGNTGNYLFDWYRGNNVNGNPFATGDRVTELSAGEYTVVATDLRTGCVSPPVTAEIFEELVYPELKIEIQGANCNEDNAAASVYITGAVEIGRIEWYDSFGSLVTTGPNMDEVPAGTYRVSVETANGCSVEEEFTILSEISAFNGISRNGDGSNSYFKIDCIEQYPRNNVKIYNRAGTLVYEGIGYNNNTIKFDGVSNRGINMLGVDLPDGTYFYVIDKNDGSKIQNGYLEIVN